MLNMVEDFILSFQIIYIFIINAEQLHHELLKGAGVSQSLVYPNSVKNLKENDDFSLGINSTNTY